MSNAESKVKNSSRRFHDELAIKKQTKIAKAHGFTNTDQVVKQPHRLSKHHALDCGNPNCYLCGNPRKTHKDKLTKQEQSFYQDLDSKNRHHNNGKPLTDEDSTE